VVTGATWDAGGGDTLIDTAANWVGDATPNLTGGNTHAIFGMGGSLATLNQNVSLHGIVLNRGADFTVTNTAAETLTLGASGISAVLPDANSRTYTLATPVTLSANQNWGITNNGAGVATLAVSGNLDDGILSFGIVKSGSGILTLSGSNSYDGVTLVQTGGIARIKSNWALGSTNGLTRIENGAWLEVSGGVTVEEPIEISGDAASQYAGALRATGGSNTWSGSITVPAGTGSRIGATGPDTFLDIAGGLYLNGGMALQNAAPVRFVNKPIVANPWWNGIYFHGGGLTIVAVTNNDFGAIDVRSGTMRMDTANAFTTRLRLSISPNGTFDLNGNSQIVGELHSGEPANATIHTLTSAQPATLTITAADNDRVYAGRLTGAVGLVKNGGKILIVSNAVNSTTGDMVVNAGTLTVAPTSSLGSGTNVTVTGGTLALQTSTGIADSATLTIADGGGAKVNVAAGQTETVGWLVLGDKGKASGTWGASGSGAANLDDVHFAGGGKINVLHGLNCTLIAIR
jgi:autotransporter-associated beta strand protein